MGGPAAPIGVLYTDVVVVAAAVETRLVADAQGHRDLSSTPSPKLKLF